MPRELPPNEYWYVRMKHPQRVDPENPSAWQPQQFYELFGHLELPEQRRRVAQNNSRIVGKAGGFRHAIFRIPKRALQLIPKIPADKNTIERPPTNEGGET